MADRKKVKKRRSTGVVGYIDLPHHALNNCRAMLVGQPDAQRVRVRLLESHGGYRAGREVTLLPGVFVREKLYPKRLTGTEFRRELAERGITQEELAAAMDEPLELIRAAAQEGVEDDPDLPMREWFAGFEAALAAKEGGEGDGVA